MDGSTACVFHHVFRLAFSRDAPC